MIPPFDESGYLPPGLHKATLAEVDSRFGQGSELRRVQVESLRWMIRLASLAGIERIVLNGSFVTDIIEPNDVDCVLLIQPGRDRNLSALGELRRGLPFLDVAIVRPRVFEEYIREVFATDRAGSPKGMIEVVEWS